MVHETLRGYVIGSTFILGGFAALNLPGCASLTRGDVAAYADAAARATHAVADAARQKRIADAQKRRDDIEQALFDADDADVIADLVGKLADAQRDLAAELESHEGGAGGR